MPRYVLENWDKEYMALFLKSKNIQNKLIAQILKHNKNNKFDGFVLEMTPMFAYIQQIKKEQGDKFWATAAKRFSAFLVKNTLICFNNKNIKLNSKQKKHTKNKIFVLNVG